MPCISSSLLLQIFVSLALPVKIKNLINPCVDLVDSLIFSEAKSASIWYVHDATFNIWVLAMRASNLQPKLFSLILDLKIA